MKYGFAVPDHFTALSTTIDGDFTNSPQSGAEFSCVADPIVPGVFNGARIPGRTYCGNVAVDADDRVARLASNSGRLRFLASFFWSQAP
jgi:hypothetical protein